MSCLFTTWYGYRMDIYIGFLLNMCWDIYMKILIMEWDTLPGTWNIQRWLVKVEAIVDRKNTSQCFYSLGSTMISWII